MSGPKITGIIHTKNESAYIRQAIDSIAGFVDEVLVADMASSDNTVEIAEGLGARVLHVPDFGFADPARGLAVEAASFDWIFVLDADEIAPPALGIELRRIASANEADVVSIPYLNFMIGKQIRHSGWGPERDAHIRFFRRNALVVADRVHAPWEVAPDAKLVSLDATDKFSIHHFNYTDWSNFVSKMNNYTTIEANRLVADGLTTKFHRSLWAALREFVIRYIVQSGYRDGYEGFVLSCLMFTYRLLVGAKSIQLRQRGNEAEIRKQYMCWAAAVADGSADLRS